MFYLSSFQLEKMLTQRFSLEYLVIFHLLTLPLNVWIAKPLFYCDPKFEDILTGYLNILPLSPPKAKMFKVGWVERALIGPYWPSKSWITFGFSLGQPGSIFDTIFLASWSNESLIEGLWSNKTFPWLVETTSSVTSNPAITAILSIKISYELH